MGQVEEFEPLPKGIYEFRLSDWEYIEESESSGEPFIKLEFTCEEDEYENRKAFLNHSLQAKALFALKRTLKALGADAETLSGEWDTDEVMPELVGNTCRLNLDVEEYEGSEVNRVKRVLPAEVAV